MNEIKQLAERVEQLIQNQEDQLAIVVETGYDESGLVGTKDAYLRLVKEVLQFLVAAENQETDSLKTGDTDLPCSGNIGALFNSRCEIGLDTTTLTSSQAETEKVIDYFYWLSPPSLQDHKLTEPNDAL